MNCHPDRSVPGFPATPHWTQPRVRLSVRERRMKCINATKFHRKSGGAQWRDLLFLPITNDLREKSHPPLCHPDRSVAQRRDLRFPPITNDLREKSHPPLCHPDRSVAQWRDLRFPQSPTTFEKSATLPFVIPTGA